MNAISYVLLFRCASIIFQLPYSLQMQKSQQVLCLSFNQDSSCIAIGTQHGFKIFSTIPFELLFNRDFGAGIAIIEMYYRTNIVAIVGGGKIPKYPKNKVIIWDDCNSILSAQLKPIAQANCKGNILAVGFKHDRIIIVLQTKIHLLNLSDLKVLDIIQTCPNPTGIFSYSTQSMGFVICSPSKTIGSISVSNYVEMSVSTKKIKVNESLLCYLAISKNGNIIAACSDKGKSIRIFQTESGKLIQQLRRGSQNAIIYRLCFDMNEKYLACSSDSGTVHVFEIKQGEQKTKNLKSKLDIFKSIIPVSYLQSEWSFCRYKITDRYPKVTFLNKQNNMGILTISNFHWIQFDPESINLQCQLKKIYLLQ